MRDLAAAQRIQECGIINQRSATGVNHETAPGHQCQGFGLQNICGLNGLGQQQDDDFSVGQCRAQPFITMQAPDIRNVLWVSAPTCHGKPKPMQRLSAGRPQRADAKDRDRPVCCHWRKAVVPPNPILSEDMGIHAKVMAQRMPRDPLHHATCQAFIDQTAKGLGQGLVVHHRLDPGPKAHDGLGSGVRAKIGHRAVWGENDIVHIRGCMIARQVGVQPRFCKGGVQRFLILCPCGGGCGKQDIQHQRGLCTCALCTRPKARSSTSIADPP